MFGPVRIRRAGAEQHDPNGPGRWGAGFRRMVAPAKETEGGEDRESEKV